MLAMVPYCFVGLIVYLDGHESGCSGGERAGYPGGKQIVDSSSNNNNMKTIIADDDEGPLLLPMSPRTIVHGDDKDYHCDFSPCFPLLVY
jgi:hypothetical protein